MRTHHLWSEWLRQLRIAAFESLPFSVGLGPLLSPPFWDNLPIVINLEAAWKTNLGDSWRDALPQAKSKVIQKIAYTNFLASRFPCDLHGHIMKHAIDFCGDKNEINSAGVSAGLECAKSLPCTLATQILKSWINSWATSHRFHERIRLPCLLGCGGADSLHHYLKCQRLWDLVAVVLHDPPSFASIADRLGFRVLYPPNEGLRP